MLSPCAAVASAVVDSWRLWQQAMRAVAAVPAAALSHSRLLHGHSNAMHLFLQLPWCWRLQLLGDCNCRFRCLVHAQTPFTRQ
jgi:hypothetical protein